VQVDIEPVVKNLPEIIKQASQSPSGMLALLVILVFAIAAYFFRKAPMGWRVFVFFALLGGVVVYAVEINRVASKPEAVHYVGRTLDQLTHSTVSEASVLVSVGVTSNGPYFTDSLGAFSFWLARAKPTDDATVLIKHESYRPFDRIVPSDVSSQLGDILLESATPVAQPANSPPLEPAPAPPSPAPTATPPAGDNASPPSAAGNAPPRAQPAPNAPKAAALRARVLAERVVPPTVAERVLVPHTAQPQALPQVAAAHALLPKVVEASSGQRISGKGKNWSSWYKVQVGAAPAGYTIDKVAFWLTGDRSCGAGAECQEITKSDTEVVWQFRLQGHDEWGAPPQTFSTGMLRVTYQPK